MGNDFTAETQRTQRTRRVHHEERWEGGRNGRKHTSDAGANPSKPSARPLCSLRLGGEFLVPEGHYRPGAAPSPAGSVAPTERRSTRFQEGTSRQAPSAGVSGFLTRSAIGPFSTFVVTSG